MSDGLRGTYSRAPRFAAAYAEATASQVAKRLQALRGIDTSEAIEETPQLAYISGAVNAEEPAPPAVSIRPARLSDAAAIAHIYNEAILTTIATMDTETKTVEERTRWLESHGDRHPVLVAEVDGKVVGWASLTEWSDRPAYADTAESSFYVHSSQRGRGIGRKLKEAILDEARRLRFHTVIARITAGSAESLHLNESTGYRHVGTLREVGRKFGQLLDVHILQKILD